MQNLRKRRQRAQTRKSALLNLLLLLLFAAFIPAGSNTIFLQSGLVGAIFLLALCSTLWVPRGRAVRSSLAWLPLLTTLMGVICVMQLIVVPCGFLELIAPVSFEYYEKLALIRTDNCTGSISVDRQKTLLTGLWWFGLSAWSWMLITVTHSCQSRLARMKILLLIIAIVQACYGLLMQLSGIELGAYLTEKQSYIGHVTGTLINRNHFATVMYVATALAFPWLIEARTSGPTVNRFARIINWLSSSKSLVRLSVVIFAIAAINTHSRMGNVALAFGVGLGCALGWVLTSLYRNNGGLATGRYMMFLTASILAVDLYIVSNWFGLEQVVERIETTNINTESRDDLVRTVLVSTWPSGALVAGTGAGSFEGVYKQYDPTARLRRVDHIHNDWLQYWLEYGLSGLAVLVLGLVSFVRHLRLVALPSLVGAICLISMLALHAVVDFSLRIPAISLYVIAAFVALLSANKQQELRKIER